MATSVVSVCNSALVHVGAELITSLSDNSDSARACKQFFDDSRDSVLTQANWTFATTQAVLSKLVDTPLFKYEFAYLLPTNPYCLKPLHIESPEQDTIWKVRGRELHTNRDGVNLEYIFRNEDVSQWSPLYTVCLELFLGSRLAYPLTESTTKATNLRDQYIEALSDAAEVDAQIGIADDFESEDLIDARA